MPRNTRHQQRQQQQQQQPQQQPQPQPQLQQYQAPYPDQPPSYLEATSSGGVFQQQQQPGLVGPSAPPPPPPPRGQPQYQPQYQPQHQPPHQPPEDELSVWFYAVDEDGNGHITADELRQALLDEDCKPFSLSTCRMLVLMFDDNSNGEIELSEFVQLYHYVRRWREIFLRHDADLSGTIELDELLDSVNSVHQPLRFSRQLCTQLMRRFGRQVQRGGEFCLSLDSFIALNAHVSRLLHDYSGAPDAAEAYLVKRLRNDR